MSDSLALPRKSPSFTENRRPMPFAKRANLAGERCPPKAEVVSSNLAGSATKIDIEAVYIAFLDGPSDLTHSCTHHTWLD